MNDSLGVDLVALSLSYSSSSLFSCLYKFGIFAKLEMKHI